MSTQERTVENAKTSVRAIESVLAEQNKVLRSLLVALQTARKELRTLEAVEAKRQKRIEAIDAEWGVQMRVRGESDILDTNHDTTVEGLLRFMQDPQPIDPQAETEYDVEVVLLWTDSYGGREEFYPLEPRRPGRWPSADLRLEWQTFCIKHPEILKFLKECRKRIDWQENHEGEPMTGVE